MQDSVRVRFQLRAVPHDIVKMTRMTERVNFSEIPSAE